MNNQNDLNQSGNFQYFLVAGKYNVGEKQPGGFKYVVLGLLKSQAVKVCELLNEKN